ncbi:MAG TPA: glycoside hydrolase family 78 protein [Actinomycetota bacterium]|nr:glycoside hydrolase family 78 protein [Actinomycetota bacterium]
MKPANLRCEFMTNPIGIDVTTPRLSWTVDSDVRGDFQVAYRILATSDGGEVLWDSEKVESSQTTHVEYGGPSLAPRARVYWRVACWDAKGVASDLDECSPAFFETGLLDESLWNAEWIGLRNAGSNDMFRPSPHLRRVFGIADPVASARLYITALGLYRVWINGQLVGDDLFTPGWTDYDVRVPYQTYDVTGHLVQGENCIGAVLGDGWYSGFVGGQRMRNRWGELPELRAQLEITLEGGENMFISTDDSWQGAFGPIVVSDLLMGEDYDARRQLGEWTTANYDDSAWSMARVLSGTNATLVGKRNEPVRKAIERVAVEMTEPVPGTYVFDLGQNMVGWARLSVTGEEGDQIRLRHAEMLNPDGTIYTENLREAACVDRYTLKGGGPETYEPSFTFHGFRYVEVTGLRGKPALECITGIVVHSDCEMTGSFECSHELINQLQRNIQWGQRGNFLEVPTDCPQRDERLGWMGDAQIFARTAAFNMDAAAFLTKWMIDVRDAQSPEGAFPNVAPKIKALGGHAGWEDALGLGAPGWGDAGVIVPWQMYLCYGDTRQLEEGFDSMLRWVNFVEQCSPGLLWTDVKGWNFGDWLSINADSPGEVLATQYFAYTTALVARIARLLGRDEAEELEDLGGRIREAFNKAYVSADGKIKGETQTIYVLALQFDLLPDELRILAFEHLIRDIESKEWHLSTGFLGVTHLLPVLSRFGRFDVAYRLLTNETYPSWLYPIRHGATTIWERWDGWTEEKGFQSPGMNSFNHYAYGSVGEWMYANVGGIDIYDERPGYEQILIKPVPGGGITSAKATYDSIKGKIECDWSLNDTGIVMKVSIPANTKATVMIPSTGPVTESGKDLSEADGVHSVVQGENVTAIEIGGGRYEFASTSTD